MIGHKTMTVIRAGWSHVTNAEYDALAILRRPDTEALIDNYWEHLGRTRRVR